MSCPFSGSLVVRLVFSPFEEISYATFARGASGFCFSILFCSVSWMYKTYELFIAVLIVSFI